MRFHILGLGSIGTLVAHHLRLANPSVPISLLVRNKHRPRLGHSLLDAKGNPRASERHALHVSRDGQTTTSSGFDVESSAPSKVFSEISKVKTTKPGKDEPDDHDGNASPDPIDSLIVCVKAPATVNALSPLVPRLGPRSVITLLQNGMGVYDELCAKIWPDPITRPHFVLGTVTHGVARTGTLGSVIHTSKQGHGDIRLGIAPDPRIQVDLESWLWGRQVGTLPVLTPPESPTVPLPPSPSSTVNNLHSTLSGLLAMQELSPSLLPMPHLYHQLLRKLALNATINPLTALIGGGFLPNGILASNSFPGNRLISQISAETSEVLTSYIHSMSPSGNAPMEVIEFFSKKALERSVRALAHGTAENISSMAVDVKNGDVTEIDYINGAIVEFGQRLGIDTPIHSMLRQMIKFRTELNGLAPTTSGLSGRIRAGEKVTVAERQLLLEERKMRLREKEIQLREKGMGLNEMNRREAIRARREIKRQEIKEGLDALHAEMVARGEQPPMSRKEAMLHRFAGQKREAREGSVDESSYTKDEK